MMIKKLVTLPVRFLLKRFPRLNSVFHIKPVRPVSVNSSVSGDNAKQKQDYEIDLVDIDKSKPTLACIMDVFTKSCFQPEFNIISPTPQNWKKTLETYPLDALFVESAWHGNNDSWIYLVGRYNEKNLDTIKELISACNQKKIPAIFWNKEDPVHFDRFIDPAKRFDYIFTTDAACIPKYIEHAGHERVHALPFAAQPEIHNPVLKQPRNGMVCFAGTYHVARYAERRADMDVILKPAMAFGLDIYDRMYGTEGKVAGNYLFPDIYQPSIRGKLEYNDMVLAYRKYKVFLNVNSVRNSPTMFARRVFELLACGTPVISTYSKGIIEILGDDTVFITESEEETTRHLENLLGNETFWWTHSLRGIRKVLENHTYHHRTKEIFNLAGITYKERPPVRFLVISEVFSIRDVNYLGKMLAQQIYRDFRVMLIYNPDEVPAEKLDAEALNVFDPEVVIMVPNNPVQIKEEISRASQEQFAVMFSPDHFYGQNYLRDYALAVNYSHAGKFGKKAHFRMNDDGQLTLQDKGKEFQWVSEIPAATLVIMISELALQDLYQFLRSETYGSPLNDILSIDPYNFLLKGSGSTENTQKTISL
jgi:glycosyltransferase involved in cell wall biosynthesis